MNGLLRTSGSISVWYDDKWTGSSVSWFRRPCTAGTLRVPVHSDQALFTGAVQRIRVTGSTTPFTVALRPTERKTIVVRLQPQAGVCRLRFDVSPTRKPAGDPRTLGVLVDDFQYEPAG